MAKADRPIELFLRRLMLRSTLNIEEQNAILDLKCTVTRLESHRDFVIPGQVVDNVSLVGDGVAARFDLMRDGSRAIAELFVAGDVCDLASLVSPRAGWGLSALGAVEILQIPHHALRRLLSAYPEIGLAFWRDCNADAGVLAKWVGNIGRKDGKARIAHLLCEMGRRIEATGLATRHRYPLHMSQEQIGDAMGLTTVHVNRMLGALRKEGAVSFHSQIVEVHDWDRLAATAEFDEEFLLLDRPQSARLLR